MPLSSLVLMMVMVLLMRVFVLMRSWLLLQMTHAQMGHANFVLCHPHRLFTRQRLTAPPTCPTAGAGSTVQSPTGHLHAHVKPAARAASDSVSSSSRRRRRSGRRTAEVLARPDNDPYSDSDHEREGVEYVKVPFDGPEGAGVALGELYDAEYAADLFSQPSVLMLDDGGTGPCRLRDGKTGAGGVQRMSEKGEDVP